MSSHVLTLFNPIVRAIKKGYVQYQNRKEDKAWNTLRAEELAKLDSKSHNWYTVLVDNQLKTVRGQKELNANRQQKVDASYFEFLFKLGCKVAREYAVLPNIIGMQPLHSPVGLVYHMEYTQKPVTSEQNDVGSADIGKYRLEVISHAVVALTERLSTHVDPNVATVLGQKDKTLVDKLVDVLGGEIAREMLIDILNDLRHLGRQNRNHFEVITASDSHKAVYLNKICNEIAAETRRGPANWIIASISTVSKLQSAPFSYFSSGKSNRDSSLLLMHVGRLNGVIEVYASTEVKDDEILIGYMGGNGATDTGYVFAPYIPVVPGNVVLDPVTLEPMVEFMTRYGKTAFKNLSDDFGNLVIPRHSTGEKYYRIVEFAEPKEGVYDPTALVEDFVFPATKEPQFLAPLTEQLLGKSNLNIEEDSSVELKTNLPDSTEVNDKPFV